jgi:hypothetical protein
MDISLSLTFVWPNEVKSPPEKTYPDEAGLCRKLPKNIEIEEVMFDLLWNPKQT